MALRMSTCPHCGESLEAAGNAEREVVLRVPERHLPLFRKLFREMSTRLGMMGQGELANQLTPYREAFSTDFSRMRYIDDGALAMVTTGLTMGYPVEVRISEDSRTDSQGRERHKIHAVFTMAGGREGKLMLSESAPRDAAEWLKAHIMDLAERLAPPPDERGPTHGG